MPEADRLPRVFFERNVVEVARALIGCTLWTARADGVPGIAYIYRSYGIHTMLNLVCEPEGAPAAVLIRALEPVEGLALMRARRGIDDSNRLCKGPGSLTSAMGIGLGNHGVDVTTSVWIWLSPAATARQPVSGERIGISRGKEMPWRFFVADSPFVSSHRRAMAVDSAP